MCVTATLVSASGAAEPSQWHYDSESIVNICELEIDLDISILLTWLFMVLVTVSDADPPNDSSNSDMLVMKVSSPWSMTTLRSKALMYHIKMPSL